MTTFIDLFCGAGGLSLGLREAGWRSLLAVDKWADAIATYKKNFPDEENRSLCEDVESLTQDRLTRLFEEKPDWVVGGPPCQGFSTVGKRERDDPRNKLVREFAGVVQHLGPEGFVIENVVGLRDMKFVRDIVEHFATFGYRVTPHVLPAADYGVPQLRRRIFFVGSREGFGFLRPPQTHRPGEYLTVWDAIGDLPELNPGEERTAYCHPPKTAYQKRMRHQSLGLQGHVASNHPPELVKAISFIPDGGNRRDIPAEFQPKSGFHNSYSRLHSKTPAVAVTQNMGKPSGTRCIHPFQHRGLTAREGARLQGFPDRFHFVGGMMSQRLQIANAISPILAKALGEALVAPTSWTERLIESDLLSVEVDQQELDFAAVG